MANPQAVGTYGQVQLNYGLASQSVGGNSSNINWNLQLIPNGAYTGTSSTYNWNFQVPSGNAINSGSGGSIGSSGSPVFASGTFTLGHDANGNGYADMGGYFNWYNGSGTAYQGYTPPRIPLAPPISSLIVDTIKQTSVRFGIEISSYGHGTVAAMYPHYRLQGTSTWINVAAQNDVVGYNYFGVTGLKPGKTYEFYATAYNNNGDSNDTAVYTFKTKPASGMISMMKAMM